MGQSRSLTPFLRSLIRLPRAFVEEDTSLTFDHAIDLPPATETAASQFMDEMEKSTNFNAGELERLKRRFMKLDA